jgi:hypothetical protein
VSLCGLCASLREILVRDARLRYKDGAMGAIERCSKLLQVHIVVSLACEMLVL